MQTLMFWTGLLLTYLFLALMQLSHIVQTIGNQSGLGHVLSSLDFVGCPYLLKYWPLPRDLGRPLQPGGRCRCVSAGYGQSTSIFIERSTRSILVTLTCHTSSLLILHDQCNLSGKRMQPFCKPEATLIIGNLIYHGDQLFRWSISIDWIMARS